MYKITNCKEKLNKTTIFVGHEANNFLFIIPILPFFSKEDFLFTLRKTFNNEDPKIENEEDIYKVYINKKDGLSLGNLIAKFYKTASERWLYY